MIKKSRAIEYLFLFYPWAPLLDYTLKIPINELLTVLIILISIKGGGYSRFIHKNKDQVAILSVFLILTLISTLLFNFSEKNILIFFRLLMYFFLVISVGGGKYKPEELQKFLLLFYVSVTTISLLTLIDYFKMIDIPFFNESSLLIGEDQYSQVADMSGIFNNRNQYAIYLGIAFPIGLFQIINSKKRKWLFTIMLIITLVSIFLSFSRGVILAVLILLLFEYKKRMIKVLFITLLAVFMFLNLGLNFKFIEPYTRTMAYRSQDLILSDETVDRGDKWRYISFLETLQDIPQHPIGFGWGNLQSRSLGEEKSPHNTFVSLFRSGGILGLILLLTVLYKEKNWIKFYLRQKQLTIYLQILFVLLIFSLTHEITGTLIMWCIVGIVLSSKNKYLVNE